MDITQVDRIGIPW